MHSILSSFRPARETGLVTIFPRVNLLALFSITSACLLGISTASAENEFSVDWSNRVPNSTPEQVEDFLRIAFLSTFSDEITFVYADTDPVNPFSHLENSLYVNSEAPNDGWFRLLARPFVEEPVLQGALEFEFRIVSGSIHLMVGECKLPWQPDDFKTYAVSNSKFGAAFRPGEYVQIQGRPMRTGMGDPLEADKNYTFLVKWDFSGLSEPFTFFLNGEPLTFDGGSPFPMPTGAEASGINAFRITIGTPSDKFGAIFLGRLAAASGDKDAYSPEGILPPAAGSPSPSR